VREHIIKYKTKPVENSNNKEFLSLYVAVHTQLSRFCRAISGNTNDAEDLMNDVILNVLEDFGKIRNKSAFKSYVFSIASNLNKKKQRRRKFKADFSPSEINLIADVSNDQEYLTDFKIIYDLILSFPVRTSETMILFHISDLSIEEIKRIQGGSISGVKQRLKRGREKLLSQLRTPEHLKAALIFLTL
jgi:RNA polymerase sigma-70 factor (ECF subfamily)